MTIVEAEARALEIANRLEDALNGLPTEFNRIFLGNMERVKGIEPSS